jgi:hypothetical protein
MSARLEASVPSVVHRGTAECSRTQARQVLPGKQTSLLTEIDNNRDGRKDGREEVREGGGKEDRKEGRKKEKSEGGRNGWRREGRKTGRKQRKEIKLISPQSITLSVQMFKK